MLHTKTPVTLVETRFGRETNTYRLDCFECGEAFVSPSRERIFRMKEYHDTGEHIGWGGFNHAAGDDFGPIDEQW